MKSLLRSWLGVQDDASAGHHHDALRDVLDALDRLEPERARHLAAFAYLLGRIAHADQHVSAEETHAMEEHVAQEGQIPRQQAMLVVGLAKTSNLLFGGTANFLVAREFEKTATHEQKLALLRCLFAVSAAEGRISVAEEGEIQRIARELKVEHGDVVKLRLAYRDHLPGLAQTAPSHADRIAAAVRSFKEAHEAFIAALEAIDQPERVPQGGGWTASQIAWHLADTNLHVAGLLTGRAPGTKLTPGFAEDPSAFAKIPERVPTPIPDVHPPATVTRADAIARLRASKAPTMQAIESLTEQRGRNVTVDLPFGTINLYQLAEWAGAHATRHRGQLTRLS
jgi:uncharacterized tellurite resistance protein B-like protein/uncharacterized damage-inducible protein DinB